MDYEEDRPATMQEAAQEYAANVGADHPDQEWICTQYDSWERNPFYQGLPGRHPEEDDELEAHACMDNAVPYESDGALGHGWECGVCGAFLQAG